MRLSHTHTSYSLSLDLQYAKQLGNFINFGPYMHKWHVQEPRKNLIYLKGQSHEKVGEMSVWGISLGPN
jgi:hypothetical protein